MDLNWVISGECFTEKSSEIGLPNFVFIQKDVIYFGQIGQINQKLDLLVFDKNFVLIISILLCV